MIGKFRRYAYCNSYSVNYYTLLYKSGEIKIKQVQVEFFSLTMIFQEIMRLRLNQNLNAADNCRSVQNRQDKSSETARQGRPTTSQIKDLEMDSFAAFVHTTNPVFLLTTTPSRSFSAYSTCDDRTAPTSYKRFAVGRRVPSKWAFSYISRSSYGHHNTSTTRPITTHLHAQLVQANLSSETETETDMTSPNRPNPSPLTSSSGETETATSSQSETESELSPLEQFKSLPVDDRERIKQVRVQLELWLSAINLRRDWYLRRQMDKQGWLDPSTFLMFNRMKQLRGSLADIILAARLSDDIEVAIPSTSASFGDSDSALQTRVRRSSLLPDFREWDESELEKSFILKSIPHNVTVDSLKQLFDPFAQPLYVRIYRDSLNAQAAPRALVCFGDKNTADAVFEKFTTSAPPEADGILIKRRHMSNDEPNNLIVAKSGVSSTQADHTVILHLTQLDVDIEWKTLYRVLNETFLLRCGKRLRYMIYENNTDECYVTIAESPAVREMVSDIVETGIGIEGRAAKVRLVDDEEGIKEYTRRSLQHKQSRQSRREYGDGNNQQNSFNNNSPSHPSGVVLKVSGVDSGLTWKTLHSEMSKLGKIVFLNHRNGNDTCYVRLGSPGDAAYFQRVLNGFENEPPATIAGKTMSAAVLEGEEEEEYWKLVEERQKMRRVRLTDLDNGDVNDSDSQ